MPETRPIDVPAYFVPVSAVAFGERGTDAQFVAASNPLPVRNAMPVPTFVALQGSTTTNATVGPFVPSVGHPILLTVSGNWAGTVTVLRSSDGGATLLPLTLAGEPWASFTTNVNEAVAEEAGPGASYYLQITVTSGTVAYRVSQ